MILRHNLYASVHALAVALGANTWNLLDRHVNDAALTSVHRIERDDLALCSDVRRELLGHRRELLFVTSAVAFRIDHDVFAIFTDAVNDARHEVLNRFEDHSTFADDACRVWAVDIELQLFAVFRFFAARGDHGHVLSRGQWLYRPTSP